MKKILSMILCLVMVAALALAANADAINLADGCQTETIIKKANPSAVVKDGVIGAGEYMEIDINRDPETTDLLLSWWDGLNGGISLLDQCLEFLNDVHFYISWDEVNGLNMAVRSKLLETPWCATPQPDNTYYNGMDFPGDEFLFQFGALFSVKDYDDKEIVIYRGLGYNTEENTPLTGHYGRHGYTGSYNLAEGQNYAVKIDGNWVTYEISYPLASVLQAKDINGNAPADDAAIWFYMSACGGSLGRYNSENSTYIVSLGDNGYCTSKWAGTQLKNARGYFSNEEIPYAVATTPAATTEPVTEIVTEIVTSHVAVTTVDEAGNVVEVTNADGSVVTEVVTEVISEVVTVAPSTTPGQGTQSPSTGDPMIIAAVALAISACGVVVAKKRK